MTDKHRRTSRKKNLTRIEQLAKNAQRNRREWKKHPVLKTAALTERAGRRIAGGARRVSTGARRRAYAYGVAYSHGRGQSLARWARSRRDAIARHVEVDTSGMHRSLRPGMSGRRRVQYSRARARRHIEASRTGLGRHLTRTAGRLAASDSPGPRRLAGGLRTVADRVQPSRYTCPRCKASYRNTAAWVRHECVTPPGIGTEPISYPIHPDNPLYPGAKPQPKPAQPTGSQTLAGQPPQPDAAGNTGMQTLAGQPPTHPRKPATATPQQQRNTSQGDATMSAPSTPNQSPSAHGGHPAQVIGKGGVALGGLQTVTDTDLIWTLERLSAASQMVGNGLLGFSETLDGYGVDPRVIEPLKGFAQHISEGAAYPLAAHRAFWALYGHRIEPAAGSARAVKVNKFFADQR